MESSDLLSEEDRDFIRGIAARTRAENEREAAMIAIRLDEARSEARALANALASDPHVRGIFLFGSTATGRGFRLDSDIDLAVEGGDVLSHRAIAERSTFSVDVVDFLALPKPFQANVEIEGELIYEKSE